MNPTKTEIVTETIVHKEEIKSAQSVEIESTKWFDATTKEPGQPGVFEVNSVPEFDNDDEPCRRFSYWNGKVFGPVEPFAAAAFEARFGKSVLAHTITHFRGLVEAA